MENLPILQDFAPIRVAALPPPMKTKEKVEQGKGTADHVMPMGYLFFLFLKSIFPPFSHKTFFHFQKNFSGICEFA